MPHCSPDLVAASPISGVHRSAISYRDFAVRIEAALQLRTARVAEQLDRRAAILRCVAARCRGRRWQSGRFWIAISVQFRSPI